MRLSSSLIYQKSLQNITSAQSSWLKAGQQLAANKAVLTPSDDPLASSQLLVVKQSIARNDQLQATRDSASVSLNTEETVLRSVVKKIQDIQETIVSGGNESANDLNRATLATQLQSYKDELLNLANSTDGNGNYIFAGYKTDSAPFSVDADGKVSYQGGEQDVTLQVDEYRELTVSHTGRTVFLTGTSVKEPDGSNAESDIFASIDLAIKALNTPLEGATDSDKAAVRAQLDKASRGMSNSLDNVSTVRSAAGSGLTELDNLSTTSDSFNVLYADRVKELEGADLVKLISNYIETQATLQAAQSTFLSMQNMSLFQMNS